MARSDLRKDLGAGGSEGSAVTGGGGEEEDPMEWFNIVRGVGEGAGWPVPRQSPETLDEVGSAELGAWHSSQVSG